jgi:predicted metalloprotease
MRWKRARTVQVEDRRGQGGGGAFSFPGGGIPIPIPETRGEKAGMGVGGGGLLILVIFLVITFLGGGFGSAPSLPSGGVTQGLPANDDTAQFVNAITVDIQDSWTQAFAAAGRTYEPTTVVLFEGQTQTGCGSASSAVGPFYCPIDRKVFIDLGFFEELEQRFGAPGDFAEAYVIAHEFGHHVQNVLGTMDEVRRLQAADPAAQNELSVKLELQADCFAGVWAYSVFRQPGQGEAGVALEPGDIEEGIGAAEAVGDDRIQSQTQGQVNPETWTHGSSAQRAEWFQRGFRAGNTEACDTFAG